MSRVFWDSNLFIYLLEEYGDFSRKTKALAERMRERRDVLFTSTLTMGEVLVKPAEKGDRDLVERFEDVLRRRTVLVSFEPEAARMYASIRKDRSIKIADAIQLACAAQEKIDLFITNDEELSGKNVPGIHFITSLDRSPI